MSQIASNISTFLDFLSISHYLNRTKTFVIVFNGSDTSKQGVTVSTTGTLSLATKGSKRPIRDKSTLH